MSEEQKYYCEVDEYLYEIRENKGDVQAFALIDDGTLEEVPPARIIAVGIRVSEEEFLEEKEELLKEHKAKERQRNKHPLMRKANRRNKPQT